MHGLIAVPRSNPWCDKEDRILREGVARGAKDAEIARALSESGFNRTRDGVAYRRRDGLKIKRPRSGYRHLDPRVRSIIREKVEAGWVNKDIANHIAAHFGHCSVTAVREWRIKLGIPSRKADCWSKREQDIVYDNFVERYDLRLFRRIHQLLKQEGFSRSSNAVEAFCRRAGLIENNEEEEERRGSRLEKQDAKFCAAMRAAPECPPQYRAEAP
jgi:hypothetical protein